MAGGGCYRQRLAQAFGTTACWTLKTHFDRCISSLAVDAQQGADDTRSPKRLRVALAGTTLSKPAIYTYASGIKLNNDMQEGNCHLTMPGTRQPAHSFLKKSFLFTIFRCEMSL